MIENLCRDIPIKSDYKETPTIGRLFTINRRHHNILRLRILKRVVWLPPFYLQQDPRQSREILRG